MMRALAPIIFIALIYSPAHASDRSSLTIEQAVKLCVAQARNISGNIGFDAYYNPANGKVPTNAFTAFDMTANFQFQKCMAENGFPLTYKEN